MEADKLRDVAWALDALSKLTKVLYEPIAHGPEMRAAEVTITCNLTKGGEPMSPEDAKKLLDWVDSDEMQDDLRRMADELEQAPADAG